MNEDLDNIGPEIGWDAKMRRFFTRIWSFCYRPYTASEKRDIMRAFDEWGEEVWENRETPSKIPLVVNDLKEIARTIWRSVFRLPPEEELRRLQYWEENRD